MSPNFPLRMYFVGGLIAGRTAALRTDLHNSAGLAHSLADGARFFHGVGQGLFDIRIAAGADGFDAVLGMLEIGCRDNDRVNILAGVEFIIVAHGIDVAARCRTRRRIRNCCS